MKDLTQYEDALELKQLGFDEITDSWRQHGEGISGDVEGKRDYYNRKGDVYTALPTYSQAFRFFREKYGLVGLVHFGTNEFTYNVYNEDGLGLLTKEHWNFNGTYDEAELACLRELIKIVKDSGEETKEIVKSNTLPTADELDLMSKKHVEECGLQNFFDVDEITIIKHHWCRGYVKAINDFVNSEYKL